MNIHKHAGIFAGLVLGASSLALPAHAADPIDPSNPPLGYIAPIVLSDGDLYSGAVKAYRPWFENGAWQGDIIEYSVSSTGALSTSIDVSGASPVSTGNANWSALLALRAAEQADSDYWDTSRKIITYNGTQKAFRWASLSPDQKTALDENTDANGPSDLLNWVRGDRTNESLTGGFRTRLNLLGDIVHANPVYVGRPDAGSTANAYATWAESLNSRAPRVYAGANDGMLHVFDATDGSEVYAYVPSMLFENLSFLASRPFAHRYFVDGKLTASDAYINSNWRTILAGTLGAGGKGVFVLDITNPDLVSESSTDAADQKILLEYSGDDDLGYTFGKPLIVQMNDDDWYVVLGNGYGSVNGVAKLVAINLETGVATKITTGSGTLASPNGLSSPALIDEDRDGKVDIAYAGDIDGQLWKFDLSGGPGSWAVSYSGTPLYAGTSAQPITTTPDVAAHPAGGYLIAFGTGRSLTADDSTDTTAQAIVGIRDDGSTPPSAANLPGKLLAVPWLEATYTKFDVANSKFTNETQQVSIFRPDAGDVDWTTKIGWKQTLPGGLKVLDDVQIRAGRVKSTVVSGDLSETWIVENMYLDGGKADSPIFDLNRDGTLNYYDRFGAPGIITDIPMGWSRGPGILSRVTIGRIANGSDAIFVNRLEPFFTQPCTGSCAGGLQGGHMDVDTWHSNKAIDDGSTKHDHEYDKDYGRVYVDAFDVNAGGDNGHVELAIKPDTWLPCDADCIANDQEFVVIVSNADFSPGSQMTVGTKERNVVDYQREIHNALKLWTDPDADPVDSDGDSLLFTLNSISAGGGTLRHSFSDFAIIAGGLHPTQTGCVKGDPDETYDMTTQVGRWRNGALTTQIVDADFLRDQLRAGTISSAIEGLNIQKPVDLIENLQLPTGNRGKLYEDYNTNGVIEDSNQERMGGLLAKNGAERLWENTIFWHFKGDCYGEANWLADRIQAVLAALGDDDAFDALIEELERQAEEIGCPDTDAGCDPQTYIDEQLEALFAELFGLGSTGVSGGDGENAVITQGELDSSVTSGPSTVTGRQSWTDVVLQ